MLTIDGYPVCEVDGTFGKGINLSIFYCFCFVKDIPPNISEEQVMEEKDPDLEWGYYFRVYDDTEDH